MGRRRGTDQLQRQTPGLERFAHVAYENTKPERHKCPNAPTPLETQTTVMDLAPGLKPLELNMNKGYYEVQCPEAKRLSRSKGCDS
jgi:hypothetical protein